MQKYFIDRKWTLITAAVALMVIYGAIPAVRSQDKPAATQPASQPVNLALNKTATASSTESDEHAAGKAVDGDGETRWCADAETAPQWLQVDLGKPATLSGCEIKWEFDEKQYQYMVEGSADGTAWKTLSDQSKTTEKKQVQAITFKTPADGMRYFRVRITGLDDGCWASILELQVLGNF